MGFKLVYLFLLAGLIMTATRGTQGAPTNANAGNTNAHSTHNLAAGQTGGAGANAHGTNNLGANNNAGGANAHGTNNLGVKNHAGGAHAHGTNNFGANNNAEGANAHVTNNLGANNHAGGAHAHGTNNLGANPANVANAHGTSYPGAYTSNAPCSQGMSNPMGSPTNAHGMSNPMANPTNAHGMSNPMANPTNAHGMSNPMANAADDIHYDKDQSDIKMIACRGCLKDPVVKKKLDDLYACIGKYFPEFYNKQIKNYEDHKHDPDMEACWAESQKLIGDFDKLSQEDKNKRKMCFDTHIPDRKVLKVCH